MDITVKCFATLSDPIRCAHDAATSVTLTANHANAGDVAERLAIAAEDIALVFVNGRRAGLDAALADGDRIAFVPAVGGM